MIANIAADELIHVVGVIDPDATSASTVTSDWVAINAYHQFIALVSAGTLGSSATVDAKLEQATDSSGTGAKDVTNSDITQLTQAGTDSDKQAIIVFRPQASDVEGRFTHIRLSITVATAASDISGHLFGVFPRYSSTADLASVDEIVRVFS